MTLDDLNIAESEKKQMKEMQSAILEILSEFDRLCKKNNITYHLHGGSLLGAVRHKGFIPWDEDADIAMTRDQFDILIKHRNDLEKNFQLVLPDELENDSALDCCFRIYHLGTKLRKTSDRDKYYGDIQNHVWLDIFVYEKVPNNNILGFIQYSQLLITYMMIMGHRYKGEHVYQFSFTQKIIVKLFSSIGKLFNKKTLFKLYWKISTKYNNKPNLNYRRLLNDSNQKDKWRCKRNIKDLEKTIYVPFENIQLPIPTGYDSNLKMSYGNYMQEPSKEQVESEINSKHFGYRDQGFSYTPSLTNFK